jgi:DNA-binding MarR family transcriptional regulator
MRKDAGEALDRLFEVTVVLGELMNRRLAEHGLTPARAEVVALLHRDGPLTQRQLSQALKCTPRNVTGLIDALEKAGFVARNQHPTDRRATLVTLTDRGQAVAMPWHTDRDQGIDRLLGTTSAADLETFVTVLDRVLTSLHDNYEPR